jgi:hypothetical protein
VLSKEKLDEIRSGLKLPWKIPKAPCIGGVGLEFKVCYISKKTSVRECERFTEVQEMSNEEMNFRHLL